jgi:hypothetical protein
MILDPCLTLTTILKDSTIKKQFNSKKNRVYWINTEQERFTGTGKQFVFKEYNHSQQSLEREADMLQKLKIRHVAVPHLFYADNESIVIEYIEGPLLLDFICWQESVSGTNSSALGKPVYQVIYSLCCWLKDFYTAARDISGKQIIMGDINFRNFIIREKIYGVDFEECREGRIEEDIGRLCAFAITYTPAFTSWKIAMTGELFRVLNRELGLDKEVTKRELQKELLAIARRRSSSFEMVELLLVNLFEKVMAL